MKNKSFHIVWGNNKNMKKEFVLRSIVMRIVYELNLCTCYYMYGLIFELAILNTKL